MSRNLIWRMCLLGWAAWLSAGVVFAAPPFGLDERPAIGPFADGKLPSAAVVQTGNWSVVDAFPNLSFTDPTLLLPEPGTNRLYVSSRQGKIFAFENDPAASESTLVLDLADVTQGWDDCGLLAFDFHPEFGKAGFPNRGYLYVWYHYSPKPTTGPRRPPVETPGYNRLSRFTVADGTRTADRSSELVLINQFDHNLWHDGSGLFFGNDGFLYLGVSDEGDAYDSFNNSQKINDKMFGGALRIDVDCDPNRSHPIRRQPQPEEKLPEGFTENNYTANYFIPNDNPFLDEAGGRLEEFWAVGLRNPHRMTIDRPTGHIWCGDIGQNKWEEIDIVERAGNYQWSYLEGLHPVSEDGVMKFKPAPAEYLGVEKPPLYEYAHGTEGKCIIGGYVYRGKQFAAELEGKYIFGDNGSGRIWAMTWDGHSPPTLEYLCHVLPGVGYSGLSSFGFDHQGEQYLLKMGRSAKILKMVRAEEAARKANITFAAPERLSWMGIFADMATLTPIPGFIAYDVNSPLWSDAAIKTRWIGVPSGERIKYAPSGEWSFPDGTVFIKQFDIIDNEETGERRRLETRLLVRQAGGGVYGVSYKWRGEKPEADLVCTPMTERVRIKTATGTREQNWYFPGPMDCLVCHNTNAGDVLGVNARQLNGQFTYSGGVTDNQLRTWSHLGLFDQELDDAAIGKLRALVRVDDTSATLEHRARSYLDANCAQCHRPNGAAGYFDARIDTPLAEQGLLAGRLAKQLEDVPDAQVVCPGDTTKSMLYHRVKEPGDLQMPPLAKNVNDEAALATLEEWIKSLPAATK